MDEFKQPVVMVSHPRSGRNWLRYMMERAFEHLYGVNGPIILSQMIHMSHDGMGLHKTKKLRYMTARKWGERKYSWNDRKVIFVARDPRDAVVSNYYLLVVRRHCDLRYGKTKTPYTMSRFFRDLDWGIDPICRWFQWWAPYVRRDDVHFVTYEELKTRPAFELQLVLDFLPGDHEVEDWMVQAAADASTFEKLRGMELKGYHFPDSAGDLLPGCPETMQFRRGVVGGWRDELDEETQEYCHGVMCQHLVGVPPFDRYLNA